MSKYPRPSITADVVLMERTHGKVCLVQRLNEPFKDKWALPGGFFTPENNSELELIADPSIEYAALRELREETTVNLLEAPMVHLEFFRAYDTIGRDPRGRVVSFVYLALFDYLYPKIEAADDAKAVQWVWLDDIFQGKVPMAFDHEQVLRDVWTKITQDS